MVLSSEGITMSRFVIIVLTATWCLAAASGCSDPAQPLQPPNLAASIAVHVSFGDTPIAGKTVEILETHETKSTGDDGFAHFEVTPGSYTIRVYNVNSGGPALHHVDFPVDLKSSETKTIEVFDCLVCV